MLPLPLPRCWSISAASRGETRGFPYFSLSSLIPRPPFNTARVEEGLGMRLPPPMNLDGQQHYRSLLLILKVAQITPKTSTWSCVTVSGRGSGNFLPPSPPLYVWVSSSTQGKVYKRGTFGRDPGTPPLLPSFFIPLQVAVQWYVEALNWVQ